MCVCARAQVLQCRVMTDAYSRGCLNAQVVLESKFDVLKCINALHGVRYEGQQLDVRKVSNYIYVTITSTDAPTVT